MRFALLALVFVLGGHTAALAVCGDGTVDSGEDCDLGASNGVAGACCTAGCTFADSSTVCRPDAGGCDLAESCTGSSTICPDDAKSTAECRAAAGSCDAAESCNGVADDCPPDGFLPASTTCRSAVGDCDIAELCTGSDAACPPDAKDAGECRPVAGDCDIAETCDGVGNDCPPDAFVPASVVCRPSAGFCDVAETCSGSSASCPADVKRTILCRPAAGGCDVAESCDGVANDCPADAKVTSECRAAAGDCDVAESCDGLVDDCPPDAFAPPSTVCRSSAGLCDADEVCTGVGPACPPDVKSTAVCRPATNVCDAAETCDGIGDDCPPDGPAPSGTPCDDGNACTRTDACQLGVCTGTNPVVCTPLDGCHVAGTCAPQTGICSNPNRGDGSQCDDGNPCTAVALCQSGVCQGFARLPGCCTIDGECDDGLACTDDHCVANRCTHAAVDDRCGVAGDCAAFMCAPDDPAATANGCVRRAFGEAGYCTDDEDPCTIDACRSGACQHESDGSGAGCAALVAPYRAALDLLERAQASEAVVQAAIARGCPAGARTCDVTAGDEPARLVTLLQGTERDFGGAALALAGRLTATTAPDPSRDPLARGRLALGLIATTTGNLRAFLATVAQGRAHRDIAAAFARERRVEARTLLRGTAKLRRQLLRIVVRRQFFAQ